MSKQFYLSADTVQVKTDNDKRTFTGVANSGKPFNYGGQRAIVDLSTLEFHDKVPVLLLHDREKRVGYGSLKVENHQLVMSGTLLNNDDAVAIAKESDDGFPWQMSAHVQAGSTEELTNGQTAVVNGQTVTAPILILRHCRIPEVSFTPTGVDNQTSAVILSDDGQSNAHTNQGETMTIEELKQQVAELQKKIETLEKENADLKTEKAQAEAEAKKTAVEAELSAKGFSKNDKGEWQGISAKTIDVLLSQDVETAKAMIADFAPTQTAKPFPEFLSQPYQHQHDNPPQGSGNPLIDNAMARNQKPNW